ncbi:MAG: alpha-amylase family glycosyl hydrolase [Chloroflexota bacterium]|nr:alpha-amylase family glycosyl hydrolase [Chloroflexota bacterium]
MTNEHLWWQRGIIYQIYPRSFGDSDGDGVGDLPGITGHLDYLQWLGVDALWISPIFPSPMADFGYDVADYMDIHPLFGTLEDFDRLLAEAHRRGLKVILDYVPNHTSDQHPWFVESRSSRDNPKRDWYLWRDPAPDGGPPNNWLSHFGGPAWAFDEATGQYYCHLFLKEQPDLNWRNPEVQRAMLDVLRFWLDRGVDGFRVDVIWLMIKDDQFRDNPPNPDWQPGENPYRSQLPIYTADRPEVFDIIAMMRQVLDEYHERLMIGEIYLPIERLVTYYGAGGRGVHLPYNFQLILLPWDARRIAAAIDVYEAALPAGAWPNWVLGNHDRPRIASRAGAAQAGVAAMLLLTLRGTPTLYYGDEIGMHDVPIPPDLVQDPFEKNVPGLGRDPERTPMQWDAGPGAGFTTGTPWLPLADDYRTVNVAAARDDPRSLLTLHRRLIALRRAEPALAVGGYRPVPAEGDVDDVLAFLRDKENRHFLIVLNLGGRPRRFTPAPGGPELRGRVALSTRLDREGEEVSGVVELRGDEGLIVELRQD